MLKPTRLILALSMLVPLAAMPTHAADPAQKALFDSYQAVAKGNAASGKAFFHGTHGGGKADTPSCTTCHTSNLSAQGKTRAGKAIEPMAASASPKRYTDRAEVEKWFKRNCSDVLGRECSAQEKSDVLAYLLSL